MATDKSKQYYISAAPQCPLPDASIPVGAMQLMDFVVSDFSSPLFTIPSLDLNRIRLMTQFSSFEKGITDWRTCSGSNFTTTVSATLANQASLRASQPGAKT